MMLCHSAVWNFDHMFINGGDVVPAPDVGALTTWEFIMKLSDQIAKGLT